MITGSRFVEAIEIVAKVAEIREELRADEFAVAAGEPVDDVALRADDRAELGEIAAHVEEFIDERLLRRVAGQNIFFKFLQFGAKFFGDGRIVIDDEVEQRVGDAVGAARTGAGALERSVDERSDGTEGRGVEGDEVVAAEKEIEFGRVEFFRAREIDGVGDDEEVIFVVLDLGERVGRDAVLDGEGMKLEDGFEHEFRFFLGRVVEVDPEEQAFVGADESQGFAFEIGADEFAVTEDEGADHRSGPWWRRRLMATKRRK